ncbi:unnamed protein product [Phytomonas sp. Hart1]|nr:unnamed protein product [Phytomonas sp. Hart1]|eukprot:CCW68194.1 unnamed protein product [Phytomonas sp. isolate Hart1]
MAAVDGETGSRLRAALSRGGFAMPTGKVRRRPSRPRAPPAVVSKCPHNDADAKPPPAQIRRFSADETARAEAAMAGGESGTEQRPSRQRTEASVVAPLSLEVLDLLQREVFENPRRFVLSPVYRFIELLGGVEVDNHPVVCSLPSPRAFREPPPSGFTSNYRVLLVPLTGDNYLHSSGWMVPVAIEGETLAMRLRVNGVLTPTPSNWNLAPGKEANAIRTSPVADITHLVISQEEDLFVLEIDFTSIPDDTFLWSGIVACIFVEEIPLATICERVVRNYTGDANGGVGTALLRNGPDARDAVRVTKVSVKVTCPLTALPMEIPARTLTCAHMQCMELYTILLRFTQSNLWNCPLCGAPSRLHEIRVNYRLKEWLDIHRNKIDHVDYIIETPLGKPLRVQWCEAEIRDTYFIED